MLFFKSAFLLLASTYVAAEAEAEAQTDPAITLPATCPKVWQEVTSTLIPLFANDDFPGFQCGDNARAAMRAAFHDCAAFDPKAGVGGCDGSLILTDETNVNIFDDGLQDWANITAGIVKKFGVGGADLIQFAAAVAIRNCPEGPVIPTVIGRKDSLAVSGNLEIFDGKHNATAVLAVLEDNLGLTAQEVGALIGVHTSAEQCDFDLDPSAAEAPQDPTPQVFDVEIYKEIFQKNASTGVIRFDTDISLSQHPVSGPLMKSFINNAPLWHSHFVPALQKMGKVGQNAKKLTTIDCSAFIPTTVAPPVGMKRVRRRGAGAHKRSTLNPNCS